MIDIACKYSSTDSPVIDAQPPDLNTGMWLWKFLKISGTCGLLTMSVAACSSDAPVTMASADPAVPPLRSITNILSSDGSSSVTRAVPRSHTPRTRKVEHKTPRAASSRDTASDKRIAITPSEIIGKGPGGVAALLGVPTSASQRDVSLIWTYAAPDCAFEVYFYPDIKTSLWHALQYESVNRSGETRNASQFCIRRVLSERSNGAN